VQTKEKAISEFLMKIKQLKAEHEETKHFESWNPKDVAFHEHLLTSQTQIDTALKNNFDTKNALLQLMSLITAANSYFTGNPERKALLASKVTDYVLHMLNVFGLDFTSDHVTKEDVVRPFAKAITSFRKTVRDGAKAKESPGYFLSSCDRLRDEVLPQLGVKVVNDSEFDYVMNEPQEDVVIPFTEAITSFGKTVWDGAKAKESPVYFLNSCDRLRDEVLPQLGVKVVDDAEFDYYLVDKNQLLEDIANKKSGAN